MKFNVRTFIFVRENARMTKKGLAKKLGISPRTIECWEQQESRPNPKNLKALAEVFEVEAEVFSYSDADFYKYILRFIHPAEFPLIIRDLFNDFWELQELPVADRILKQVAIFDRLLPLMRDGLLQSLQPRDEPTAAQLADEALIRGAMAQPADED